MGNIFNSEDGSQAYLIFQPIYRYFKTVINTNYILSWKSRGLSAESIKPPTTSDNSLNPELSYIYYNIRVRFTGSCLKQSKITYAHKKSVNIYTVYKLGASSSQIDDYGIGFDRRGSFSFPGGGYGQNALIFEADMSSSPYIDNNKKDILVLGFGPTQGFEHTLTAAKMYSVNFTVTKKTFCLSLHYNGANR